MTISDQPLVSVIMPTYNHERFIGEAIESVLGQTLEDFELVIINDGSFDGTDAVIRTYEDKRIVYIHQNNQGPSVASNNGILRARGKYLALVSGDDVCISNRLEAQLNYALKNNTKALFSWINFIDDSSAPVVGENPFFRGFNYPNSTRGEILRKLIFEGNYFCGTTAFIEREFFLRKGLFNPCLIQTQDLDMWIRIVKDTDLVIMPEYLLNYRVISNNGNLSSPSNTIRTSFETHQIMKTVFDDIEASLFKDA
ncbi:MAG TPA: glycosyltransferase family 2 protein, partial [Phormidium sp.]